MKKFYLISILITLFVLTCNSALAKSLEKYCIQKATKQEQENLKPKPEPTEKIPSFIGSIDNLPELYVKPCTKIERYFFECSLRTLFAYSPTLDRAFIFGHRKTNWGGDFVHLEISASGTESVPNELINSGLFKDSPTLNGALFVDKNNNPLFYDGKKVTNLTQYFPDPTKKAKGNFNGWRFVETSANRVFMYNVSSKYKGEPFLMEFKPELDFSFISLPESVDNTTLRLFTPFNDSRLWGLTRDSIVTEIDEKLQNVVTVASPLLIVGPGLIEQLADGSISFYIRKKGNMRFRTLYFLKQYSSQTDCEAIFEIQQPILFTPSLND